MVQSMSIDINRVICPACKQAFFEFYEHELFRCPFCGADCTRIEEGQYETKEIVVYLDPLSGRVETEVA